MATIFVQDKSTGIDYPVRIAGSTPTSDEQGRIDQYISTRGKFLTKKSSPELSPPEKPSGGIGDLAKGFGTGFDPWASGGLYQCPCP